MAVHYFCKKHHPRCSKYVLNTEYCFEYVSGSVNYFREELHLRFLTGFWIIRLWHKVVFSLGRKSESNYIEWRLLRGVFQKNCFGKLMLSQILISNILLQKRQNNCEILNRSHFKKVETNKWFLRNFWEKPL